MKDSIFHYTTGTGLDGILKNQTLRATHYAYLNDTEEMKHIREHILEKIPKENIREIVASSPHAKADIEAHGGLESVTNKLLFDVVDQAIKTFFDVFEGPFVVSFTTAEEKRLYENGVLSMWRAYGSDGGYAIEFDRQKIESFIEEEIKEFKPLNAAIYDRVQYSDNIYGKRKDELSVCVKGFEEVLITLLNGDQPEFFHNKEKYQAFIKLMTLIKHPGFSEEKEFRALIFWEKKEIIKPLIEHREIKFREKKGMHIPYIDLFKSKKALLETCIERIIVGPHPQKELRKKALDLRLQGRIVVETSNIPYLGSH